MRIQIASDLHLERQPGFELAPAPGVDLLVLAGDIGSYQAGSLLASDDFGLGRFAPPRWPAVLYVPGNHEYDALPLEATRQRLRGCCERLGITWLDREAIVIGGVRFVGTTLWTDYDALARREPTVTAQLARRDKAYRAANHYLRRYTTLADADGRPLLAEALRELALDCQRWLRRALETPHDGPTVVVTHHAPSLRSADPRYGVHAGSAGFCNALDDDLLPLAQLWIHGHLHCRNDYVAAGGCRVVSNPLGYAAKGEQAAFDGRFVVEVG